MNIVFGALVFTTALMFALMAICFILLHQNNKIETENEELKRKLDVVHTELRSILNTHSNII